MLGAPELARLEVELSAGAPLLLVRMDSAQDRRAFRDWLEDGRRVRVVTFAPGVDPVQQVVEAGAGGDVVLAWGDESLRGADRLAWLRALNTGRDHLKRAGVPVVIALDDHGLDDLATGAPDLWSVRAGLYEPASQDTPSTDLGSALVDEGGAPATSVESAYATLSATDGYEAPFDERPWAPQVRALALRFQGKAPERMVMVGVPVEDGEGVTWQFRREVVRALRKHRETLSNPIPTRAIALERRYTATFIVRLLRGVSLDAWPSALRRLDLTRDPQLVDNEEALASQLVQHLHPEDLDDCAVLAARTGGRHRKAQGLPVPVVFHSTPQSRDLAIGSLLTSSRLLELKLPTIALVPPSLVLDPPTDLPHDAVASDILRPWASDAPARACLLRRVHPSLMGPGTTERLLAHAGGIEHDLLLLAREAALAAVVAGARRIEPEHVDAALGVLAPIWHRKAGSAAWHLRRWGIGGEEASDEVRNRLLDEGLLIVQPGPRWTVTPRPLALAALRLGGSAD